MSHEPPSRTASGLRVFLVEDEFHVLMLLEDMLTALRCEVAETASNLSDALERAQCCEVDAAVLDINLSGKRIYPVADVLRRRNVPIVFSTGYGAAGIDPEWADYPVVQKPFLTVQLAEALARATSGTRPDAGA